MRHVYQLYKYTKFVQKRVTYAENHLDSAGNIPYAKSDELYKSYAKLKHISEASAAHLQGACISNGYLWKDSFNHTYVEDGKGAKLLDSLLGIPFGLIEETLQQYHSTIAFFFGATFIAVVVALWHFGGTIAHQYLPSVESFFRHLHL